jgi:single-strand DNA-binding protein
MFSQISVIGNVGRNPEIRKMNDGSLVANFSVAVNDKYTRNGTRYEATHWFQVDVWQNGEQGLVDIVQKYVQAGTQLFVQGRPIIQKWKDKDGNDREGFRIRLGGPSAQLRLLGQPKRREEGETPAEAEMVEPGDAAPENANAHMEGAEAQPRANGRKRAPARVEPAMGPDAPPF